ncbi:Uma2 family endonuclease [Segniliparus rugosus]|uniref:Putative restriction endonuclease domain-containing protein n=1 Tax=Segniliparus rugosus (strain ATCC BAA-974 / DSM 45345 / CCUG 50838 / CIP 108380 / JCM 13579 / CDC 945) TaxID=679197 RepID=E5XN63_SEGRC|nr:Uma2 family endonuclease [Segniliparus rugosus]EFV14211.1 hypothetical protein HMPREF9336_00933 [Segniliparus rugosus ATCC BAA-974]
MTQALTADLAAPKYRWTPERFVRAWEAGVFDGERVELLDGEVVPVQIGPWHAETTMLAVELLPGREGGTVKSNATLPSGSSLPDPDIWVRRADAKTKKHHSKLLASWDPADVLLVIEVSNTTRAIDLGFKAQLYGSSGYPEYWVVTPEKVYAHREPYATGYRTRVEYTPGQQIPVPYAPGQTVDVGELLSVEADGSGDDHELGR